MDAVTVGRTPMPRPRSRTPVIPARLLWSRVHDGWGEPRIIDHAGHDPLRHPDPEQRLRNVELASQAPLLRIALVEASARLSRLHDGRHADESLVSWCYYVAHSCAPLASEIDRIRAHGAQCNLYFDAAA